LISAPTLVGVDVYHDVVVTVMTLIRGLVTVPVTVLVPDIIVVVIVVGSHDHGHQQTG
jgi:hypothetical protein